MDQVYPLAGAAGVGVNTANGNLVLHATDVAMPGIGLPLVVDRTYNSQCAGPAMAGATGLGADCWQLGTGQDVGLISFGDGSVAYTDGTGEQFLFHRTGLYSYSSPPGIDATMAEDGTVHYTLTFHASGEVDVFDGGGYLQSQTDRAGNRISYTYTASSGPEQLTSITDTQGRTTSLTYNTAGYLSQITDPAGRTYKYGYDTSNRLTSSTDPAGKITQYAYNYSSTCACSIKITDPNGNVTTTQGDSSGRVSGITDALLHTTTFTYNSGNTVVTDPNNHATTYYFDNDARTTSVKDALGHTTQTSWTSDNNPDTTTLPSGNSSKISYDANNNPTQFDVHPSSGVTVSTKAAYQNSTFPYNPSSTTDEQGNTTSYSYNSQGLVSNVQDPSSHNTQTFYNANGTVSTTIDANNHSTYYAYYSTSGAGAMVGMLAQSAAPAPLGTEEYYYNNDNTTQMITDGKGQNTFYTYDAMGRVTGISYQNADGTSAGSIGYVYDANGNELSMADNTGTTTYQYDALNRLVKKTLPNTQTVTYTYDAASNLLTKVDTGGTTTYGYDAADQVTSVKDRQNHQTTLTYDVDGNATQLALPNGVKEGMTYNGAGQLTNLSATNSSNATLNSFAYNYTNPANSQAAGIPYSVTNAAGNTTGYTYDTSNSLTQAVQKSSGGTTLNSYGFGYDPVGNLTSKTINGTGTTFTYNAADELTQASGGLNRTYTYDANGDRTSSSDGTSISLNAAGQLTSITPPGHGAIAMTYTGIGEQQRVGAGSSTYQYDGSGLSRQTDSLGNTYFTTMPDGTLLSETIPSGTYAGTYYYLSDGAGSVAALTDSTGAVKNTYSYDPLGNATSTGSVPNPFTFQGGMYDSSTQSYYTGQNYYDPATGQSFGCKDTHSNEDKCGEDEVYHSATFQGNSLSGRSYAVLYAKPTGKGSVTLWIDLNVGRKVVYGISFALLTNDLSSNKGTVLASQESPFNANQTHSGRFVIPAGTFRIGCTAHAFIVTQLSFILKAAQDTIAFAKDIGVVVPGDCD